MDKTDEALAKILTQLSDKFGTTSAHLWEVLLRQAKIDAIENILAIIFTFIIALWAVVVVMKQYKKSGKEDAWQFVLDEPLIILLLIVCTVPFIIVLFVCGVNVIDALANPEYHSLHELLTANK